MPTTYDPRCPACYGEHLPLITRQLLHAWTTGESPLKGD